MAEERRPAVALSPPYRTSYRDSRLWLLQDGGVAELAAGRGAARVEEEEEEEGAPQEAEAAQRRRSHLRDGEFAFALAPIWGEEEFVCVGGCMCVWCGGFRFVSLAPVGPRPHKSPHKKAQGLHA
jgi:hypothetical protein